MSITQRVPIVVGMRVRLKKTHPCGGDEWTVTRTGADVGAVCARCGRRVMLDREEFERRIRQVLGEPGAAPPVQESSS